MTLNSQNLLLLMNAKAKLSGVWFILSYFRYSIPIQGHMLFCFMFKDTLVTQLDVLLNVCYCKVVRYSNLILGPFQIPSIPTWGVGRVESFFFIFHLNELVSCSKNLNTARMLCL